jgi:hypothetical protein
VPDNPFSIDDWNREALEILGGKPYVPRRRLPWYRCIEYADFQWRDIINPCIVTREDPDDWFCYWSVRLFGFRFRIMEKYEDV